MFSVGSNADYDFVKTENAERWKGLIAPSLKKLLESVHPRLTAKEDALFFVEQLCMRVVGMICSKPLPHSVQDIEGKVKQIFPTPLNEWAINEAKEIVNNKKKKSIIPTDRVHSIIQKDVLQYKIDSSVSVFLIAAVEYLLSDILKFSGNYVREINGLEITKDDVEVAIKADKDLMDMFSQKTLKPHIVTNGPALPIQRTSTTYEEVVKDFIHDEKQYQRDLHMIIRVFREELIKIVCDIRVLDPIFSNIMDIYEVTVTLLGSLDDVIEMSQEQTAPFVGSCFEELAEAEEFNVYTKYAQEVTSQQSKDALTNLLNKPEAMSLMSAGHGFRDAVRYYLPKLLLVPVWHAFVYFDYIKRLMELSSSEEDRDCFKAVQGLLCRLQCDLENVVANLPTDYCALNSSRMRRQLAIDRTRDLQNSVEHWDKDVGQNCNEFIREDFLSKVSSGKRITERKVYLFDGLMVLCKANTKRQTTSTNARVYDFRLKEKYFMRRVEINDRADTDELKNSFEVTQRGEPAIILIAKNADHKNDLMADLIMVNTKSMLDRILDSILQDIERKHPLRMPSPEIYKFAVPDSSENIVLEERESTGVPLIKGASLCKLVERLTYHMYADPIFVRSFLITYRSFCKPRQLLSLLNERFNIPDPSLVYQDNDKDMLNCDTDKMHKNSQREDWKRYRKEFVQPVQFRVLNVLRHWVDHHFYDFEEDPTLLDDLLHFLENVNGKSMRKWVDSVLKIIQRKKEVETIQKHIMFNVGHNPPPIEHHLNVPDNEITLLTLHPIELARQLTLFEFELYSKVKPSELVGTPWMKMEKDSSAPNLCKLIKHSTSLTYWIEKSFVETENFEERCAILIRTIEVMMVLRVLNNFNGLLAMCASLDSAAVFRLKLTLATLPKTYAEFYEECRNMVKSRLQNYKKILRSINPPCVPFVGGYLTNLLHIEDGNPDLLPNTELIFFTKRRMISEIIGEIQQYQNQPYCLTLEPKIRRFVEALDPYPGWVEKDILDILFQKSLRVEPKNCVRPPRFPRKWPNIKLKSPGTTPSSKNSGFSIIQSSLTFGTRANAAQTAAATTASTISAATATSHDDMPSTSAIAVAHLQIRNSSTSAHTIEEQHSPPAATTQSTGNSAHNQNHNAQSYSVFANVNLPERSSNQWSSSSTTSAANRINETFATAIDINGEVPQLPKKPTGLSPSTHSVWNGTDALSATTTTDRNAFSPTETAIQQPTTTIRLDANRSLLDQQHHVNHMNNNLINVDNENQSLPTLPPSPLPTLVVSPRHELHSAGNRSPFHGTATTTFTRTSTNSSNNANHFSPTESIAANSAFHTADMELNNSTVVPVSPHVNVPTATNIEYRQAPPPLPPRRKERTESCADLAQRRQAPDAPTLPPREGELSLSPPPVPPRLHHHTTGITANATYPRSQPNEFSYNNSLLQPNTSSIMKRRNSAIEKRTNNTTATVKNVNNSVGGTPKSDSSTLMSNPMTNITNTNTFLTSDDRAISPALSSSTTTSPMTPMTPISPYIPNQNGGYQLTNDNINYQMRYRQLNPTIGIHATIIASSSSYSTNIIANNSTAQPLPPPIPVHTHQSHYHQQQQHVASTGNGGNGIIGGSINGILQANTSPIKDGTPKLPPKPGYSGNCFNNTADKGTMFLYPSTNHE